MNDLDERLRDILFSAAGGTSDMASDEIDQIKQAFIDYGWKPDVIEDPVNGITIFPKAAKPDSRPLPQPKP